MKTDIKEYSFPSKTGVADIYAKCWIPSEGAKAIFQIAHGMAEHCERYNDFASYLVSLGFAVAVNDHAGHGKSVKSDDDLGYFGQDGGWDALVEDERTLTEILKKDFPDIPVIFFGHSMGSFVAREYILRYGTDERIKAAVFCGTSGKNPASGIAIHLTDSGNLLQDPISGKRVLVVHPQTLSRLFDGAASVLLQNLPVVLCERDLERLHRCCKTAFWLIPVHTAVQNGMMPVFRPDRLLLDGRDSDEYVIGLASASMEIGGDCQAVIGV